MFGGHGKLLRVDLSEGKVQEEEIPEELFDKFLTGAGLATHYLSVSYTHLTLPTILLV